MFSGLSTFSELIEVLANNGINRDDIQTYNQSIDFETKPILKYNLINVLNVNNDKMTTGHAILLIKFTDDMYYYFDSTSAVADDVLNKFFKNKSVYILCNLDQLQDFRKDQSCGWYVAREILLHSVNKLKLKNYMLIHYNDADITLVEKHIEKSFNPKYNRLASKVEEKHIDSI